MWWRTLGWSTAPGWGRLPSTTRAWLPSAPRSFAPASLPATYRAARPPRPSLSPEELIADTDHGFYMETNRSWSIDDKRYNFQFGTEIAWEIQKGKRTRML